MPKIFVSRTLPPRAQALLRSQPDCIVVQWEGEEPVSSDRLLQEVKDGVDGLLVMLTEKIDEELLDAAGSRLKVVSTMSVGLDHINKPACQARGVLIGNTPDTLTAAVAELTIGLLIATGRRFAEAARAVMTGEWPKWSPLWMCGSQISGKVVGIVGLGAIGVAIGERLRGFGVASIIYSSPNPKPTASASISATHVPLPTLLSTSDIILLCCPLTPATRHLISTKEFAQMKPSAIFINTARGPIVDQAALVQALRNGTIAAAGLDVTDPEPLDPSSDLLKLDNCLVLPHIASATLETREEMARVAVENVLAGVRRRPLTAQVL
ncbi:glyoxylate reductase [Blyttiomyces helicus]|uniref:Glyoxylate reductase n=1 Tax=Blyttiomyces helicus TaxID=388810 RepID=A0A4P9W716_9FUNG|nr:glyoxylate reductase [Blyttiomyces helicus]|eukprot:RKO86540.1 glyoxylate reductase [Blyttiomyces helicus]